MQRRALFFSSLLGLGVIAIASVAGSAHAATPLTASVTVNATAGLGSVPAHGIGVNGGTGVANATCAVHYAQTGSWPGGFQASVTITDEAASAVNGWQLTWTWPNSGEAITQLWNGTETQSGTAVTVANASYNTTIGASGGTANFGVTGSGPGGGL